MKKPKTKIKIVIHAAKLDRKPLCGFSKKDPNKWPAGNRWASPKSKKYKVKINCPECKKRMKKG